MITDEQILEIASSYLRELYSGDVGDLVWQPLQEDALLNFAQEVGDIVYCKVNGKFYTHLVKAVDANKGCLIGNNCGRINGWTKNVYGKVVEVL